MRLRSAIARVPAIGALTRRCLAGARRASWVVGRWGMPAGLSAVNLKEALPTHIPNIAVTADAIDGIILRCAEETPDLLNEVARLAGGPGARTTTSLEFAARVSSDAASDSTLAESFRKYGSDKSTVHDYEKIYSAVLDPASATAVLEIGLGTNNPSVPSTMGVDGSPGASLRAFRDHLPLAQIYGADVDSEILFSEDRIRTVQVDATDAESLRQMWMQVADEFDLIVDDGLHSPHANLRVVLSGLPRLRVGGWLIVEDIGREKRGIWELAGRLLEGDSWETWLIETRSCLAFAVRRAA